MTILIRLWRLIWASPNTILGVAIGLIGMLFGARWQIRQGCIEFHSGLVDHVLKMMPTGSGALAMTLGHTILGQTPKALDIARDHEHIHVRQYERWGPLFIPAYLICSGYLWTRRKDPYRDNPFEVEAYKIAIPNPDPHGMPRGTDP